jgi:hypothetical protein
MNFTVELGDSSRLDSDIATPILTVGSVSTDQRIIDLEPIQWDLSMKHSPQAEDLFLLSVAVYCADRLYSRISSPDGWCRDMAVSLPVVDADVWNTTRPLAERTLGFLSGDDWSLSFRQIGKACGLNRPGTRLNLKRIWGNVDAVSLFSGGLDSLVGVINWLEENPNGRIALVGHYDRAFGGPKIEQHRIYGLLCQKYGARRVQLLQTRVGLKGSACENTLRTRSLLFLSMGMLIASSIGPSVPLIVPENGTMSINVPLTPARRGTCSTRTTNPYFLLQFESWCHQLGIVNPILNPLALKTKGECLRDCLDKDLLSECAYWSVSCGKRGTRPYWQTRGAPQCGICVPCTYRRAAMFMNHIPERGYGIDPDLDQLRAGLSATMGDDMRAFMYCLDHMKSPEDAKREIMLSYMVDPEMLDAYADLEIRALAEVRAWFQSIRILAAT